MNAQDILKKKKHFQIYKNLQSMKQYVKKKFHAEQSSFDETYFNKTII